MKDARAIFTRGFSAAIMLRILVVGYIGFISYFFTAQPLTDGIDSAQYFALNYFAHQHFIFGKDIIGTYGPLGYLVRPMDFFGHLEIATCFSLIVWGLFCCTLGIMVRNGRSLLVLVLCAFFLTRAQTIGVDYEYFIVFLIMLWLGICIHSYKKRFHVLALFFSALLWLIKFDVSVMATAGILFFMLYCVWKKKAEARLVFLLTVVAFPFLIAIPYFFYNPSLNDFFLYLKGIWEISSGYAYMSLKGENDTHLIAWYFLALYGVLIVILRQTKQRSLVISAMLILPLFFAFRRGFIRADHFHMSNFFAFSMFAFAAVILFTNFDSVFKLVKMKLFFLILLLLFIGYSFCYHVFYPPGGELFGNHQGMGFLLHYNSNKAGLREAARENVEFLKLPDRILSRIGLRTVTIMPWKTSYIAANNLNYRPFPVFQTYQAYTAFLDRSDARFLEFFQTRPDFVIFEWKQIDGRHPLIDTPALWLALYRWYDAPIFDKKMVLFERRKEARFSNSGPFKRTFLVRGEQPMSIPDSDSPVLAKISLKLTGIGSVFKFLYKIPVVLMSFWDQDNIRYTYRVMPETLSNGVIVNYVPMDGNDIGNLFLGKSLRKIVKFSIFGRGSFFFEPYIKVEFSMISMRAVERILDI